MWARLDDLFPWHRKVRRMSDGAFRLHITGVVACARDLTDGIVTADDIDDFPPMRGVEKRLDELVQRDLWHPRGHACEKCEQPPAGAWVIHDYLDWNPSKAQVEEDRAAARERQRRRRQKRNADVMPEGAVTPASRVTHAGVTRESQTPTRPDQPDPSYPSRPLSVVQSVEGEEPSSSSSPRYRESGR